MPNRLATFDTPPPQEQAGHVDPPEEVLLRLGYFALMVERWPFNSDYANCHDEGSALLLSMEQEYLDNYDNHSYDVLFGKGGQPENAPEDEKNYMKGLWEAVEKSATDLVDLSGRMMGEYDRGSPEQISGASQSIVREAPYDSLRGRFSMAAAAIVEGTSQKVAPTITPTPRGKKKLSARIEARATETHSLTGYLSDDRARRYQLYTTGFKKFMVANRLWREMLIENVKVGEGEHKTQVNRFELYPVTRHDLVIENRYLKVIDIIRQIIPILQTLHHQQPVGDRMRREEKVPFVYHPIAVLSLYIRFVLPFIIESDKFDINEVIEDIITFVLHDVAEDTTQKVKEAIGYVVKYDSVDSALDKDDLIKSAFAGRDREYIKEHMLRLVKKDMPARLEIVLSTLSNKSVLGWKDYQRVASRGHLPKEFIRLCYHAEMERINKVQREGGKVEVHNMRHNPNENLPAGVDVSAPVPIDIDKLLAGVVPRTTVLEKGVRVPVRQYEFYRVCEENPSAKEFPKLDDMKLALHIMRVEAFTNNQDLRDRENKVKMFDRCHNIVTLGSFTLPSKNSPEYPEALEKVEGDRKKLRGTVSELLAYVITDQDTTKHSLDLVIPVVVAKVLQNYSRFTRECPQLTESKDHRYIAKLKEFAGKFPIRDLPEKSRTVVADYHAAKSQRPENTTPQELVSQPTDSVAMALRDLSEGNVTTSERLQEFVALLNQ